MGDRVSKMTVKMVQMSALMTSGVLSSQSRHDRMVRGQ